jgi:hypothetical protein
VACLAARNNESLVGSVGSLATSWTVKIIKLDENVFVCYKGMTFVACLTNRISSSKRKRDDWINSGMPGCS